VIKQFPRRVDSTVLLPALHGGASMQRLRCSWYHCCPLHLAAAELDDRENGTCARADLRAVARADVRRRRGLL
jgi:hypothetical protein